MTDDLVKLLRDERRAMTRNEADAATIADLRAENERLRAMTAQDDDAFYKAYGKSFVIDDWLGVARVLSTRLRRMDHRAKKANQRADKTEAQLTAMTANADALARVMGELQWLCPDEFQKTLDALAHHNQLRKEG